LTISIGSYEFDVVHYDSRGDVLYLQVSDSQPEARTDATAEGHAVTWDRSGNVIGMTIVNAKWLLERDGKITMTVPDLIETRAADLAPALTAS
jgi:YD repeat-containing protein